MRNGKNPAAAPNPDRAVKKELPMSLFSVNTNLGAMAALKSLSQTASAMSQTQQSISTGKKVGMASDNPAVYAISQAMNSTISGLAAVQDGLSFGAQVVTTASTGAKANTSSKPLPSVSARSVSTEVPWVAVLA